MGKSGGASRSRTARSVSERKAGSASRVQYEGNGLRMRALSSPAAPREMVRRARMWQQYFEHHGYSSEVTAFGREIARYRSGDVSEPSPGPDHPGETTEDKANRYSEAASRHSTWTRVMGQLSADPSWRTVLKPALDRGSDLNVATARLRDQAEAEHRAAQRQAATARGLQNRGLTPLLEGRPSAFLQTNGRIVVLKPEQLTGGSTRLHAYLLGEKTPEASFTVSGRNTRDEIARLIGTDNGRGSRARFLTTLPSNWSPPSGSSTLARLAREYLGGGLSHTRQREIEGALLGTRTLPKVSASRATRKKAAG